MLTDKRILVPGVTNLTLLLDILPAEGGERLLSPAITRLLSYAYLDTLHLVRSPRCVALSGTMVSELQVEYDSQGNLLGANYDDSRSVEPVHCYAPSALWRPRDTVRKWTDGMFDDMDSADERWSRILPVASAALMDGRIGQDKCTCLFVTNDADLLSEQIKLQRLFASDAIRIVTEAEALRIVDLHQKQMRKYMVGPGSKGNRYGWYLAAAGSDLPNVSDPSIVTRARHIRYAIDALGTAYYGNDFPADTEECAYHFGYLLVLLTGALDANGVVANAHFGIGVKDWLVSMKPAKKESAGSNSDKLYKGVTEKCPQMGLLWKESTPFLRLLYGLRNAVAHRNLFESLTVFHSSRHSIPPMVSMNLSDWRSDEGRTAEQLFGELEDPQLPFEPCTRLGVLPVNSSLKALGYRFLVEPYHFSVEAWLRVRHLLNESAKLMGIPDQLLQTNDDSSCQYPGYVRSFKREALSGLPMEITNS